MLQEFLRLLARPLAAAAGMTLLLCLVSVAVASKHDVDNVCPNELISGYLRLAYLCKSNEFYTISVCGEDRKFASCPRDKYIAIYLASIGTAKSVADCSSLRNKGCPLTCILRQVNAVCLGKRRCEVRANDPSLSTRCLLSEGAQLRPTFLQLIYTCVSNNVVKNLRSENATSILHDRCTEKQNITTKGSGTPSIYRPNGKLMMADANSVSSPTASFRRRTFQPHSSNENLIKQRHYTTYYIIHRSRETPMPYTTKLLDFSTSKGNWSIFSDQLEPKNNSSSSLSLPLFLISEWLSTWKYICNNTEKVILYFLCGLCLGVILLLVVVILRLALSSGKQETANCAGVASRLADSSNSVKWRAAGSEISTGDDRIHRVDDDEIEATTDRHTDQACDDQPYRSSNKSPCETSCNSPAETTRLKEVNDYKDSDGVEMNPSTHDSVPVQLKAQSLQRTAPYGIHGDAVRPPHPKAQTLQPTTHYYR